MGRQVEGPMRTWGHPGRRSSWLPALLAVSLLLPPAAGLSVTQEPANPVEGQSVTLTPQGLSDPFASCAWYRGDTTDPKKRIFIYYPPPSLFGTVNGPAHTERDTRVATCSLQISDLALNYSGIYTVSEENPASATPAQASVNLTVSENLNRTKTVLEPTEFMVPENWYVTLKCNTSKSDGVSVSWFKNGEALLTGTGLSDRNRTLNITGVSKNNTGFYTCEARNPVSKSLSNLSNITVAYGPDHIKFNQEGSIQQQIGSTLTLECIVDSVPAAQFQWWLNNTKLNKMGRIYTTQLTWEDGGNYTCQATNPFTNHSDSASVYVTLTKDSKPIGGGGLSGGAIAGIVIGVLAGVALIAGLVYYLCAKTSLGRTDQHASNGNIPSAPGRNQGATDTKPTSREEDIQYSTLAFNKTNASPPQPASEANQPLDSSTIYSEIKKK